MAAANALDKYLRKVRFWFPRKFSKGKTQADRMAREDLKDEFLVDIRQKAIRLQDNGSLFTYKELVQEFGTHTYVSNIRPIRELKTFIVNSENIMPSIDTFESRGDTVE